jgi:signal transduction histidine kinase
MTKFAQALWDQMRADLRSDALPQLDQACHSLRSDSLGSLTENQAEDLASIERSLAKLSRRAEGEPIDWSDYSEAAHALRGPLNSTIGFSRLMLKGIDGPINEAQREALETIYSVSRRMLALFNLLLDALLLIEDGVSFDVEPVRADLVMEQLIATGRTLADNRGFAFNANVTPQVLSINVRSDAKRLMQALSALLAVSVKYMNDGTMALQADLSGTRLVVRFENQRCALPMPLLENLPYLLTDAADRSFPYDAQLRLGLAWHLLKGMQGHLEAHKTGTTCAFIVDLPID